MQMAATFVKSGLPRPSKFHLSARGLRLFFLRLGNIGIRRDVFGEELFHQRAIAFGGKDFDHEVGGLGRWDGGGLPETTIGEFQIKSPFPGENDLKDLRAGSAYPPVLGAGLIAFGQNAPTLQGRIQHPAVTGGRVGGQTNFNGVFRLGFNNGPIPETAACPKTYPGSQWEEKSSFTDGRGTHAGNLLLFAKGSQILVRLGGIGPGTVQRDGGLNVGARLFQLLQDAVVTAELEFDVGILGKLFLRFLQHNAALDDCAALPHGIG